MSLKGTLLPIGILLGAIVLGTGFFVTHTLLAAHASDGDIAWSQPAGDGAVFPACGSASPSGNSTCVNSSQASVTINWSITGIHYNGGIIPCDQPYGITGGVHISGGPGGTVFVPSCRGSYTFNNLSSGGQYTLSVQGCTDWSSRGDCAAVSSETFPVTVNAPNCAPPPPSSSPPATPTNLQASCSEATGHMTWSPASGAADYRVILYVPINDSCPGGWTDGGTSVPNQNRECLGFSSDTTVTSVALIAGHNYVAYVQSRNSADLYSSPSSPVSFSCAAPPPRAMCPNGDVAPNNDASQCTCAQGNQNACSPAPTASLLAADQSTNNQLADDITVNAGDTVRYQWSSTNATSYTTTVTDNGGTAFTWGSGNTASGNSSGIIGQGQAGHTYQFTYKVTGPGGSGQSVLFVRVRALQQCPNGDTAPGNDSNQCSCAQGNQSACATCPDGSVAPNGDAGQCTCGQGNQEACTTPPGGGGGSCTDPLNCSAPAAQSAGPGACNMAVAPDSTVAGGEVLLGWASACDGVGAGCTRSAFGIPAPVVSGNTSITHVGAVSPSSGSNPLSVTVSGVPISYTLSGQLYWWPLMVPVSGTNYSCTAAVAQGALCSDGSAPPCNGVQCTLNSQTCSADGQYVHSTFTPANTCEPTDAFCEYGCVQPVSGNAFCDTPAAPTASFSVLPTVVRSGSTVHVLMSAQGVKSCTVTSTKKDGSNDRSVNASKATGWAASLDYQSSPILDTTIFTLHCIGRLNGSQISKQITVTLVPKFIEN